LLGEHKDEVAAIKEQHLATQTENAKLKNEIEAIKEINKSLGEKNEIMIDTEAILTEDNERLRNTPAERNLISNQEQLLALTKRVDNIKVELFQKEQELKETKIKYELLENSFNEQRNLFEDEIDSLKDQNELLKGQCETLQQNLRQQNQSALLQLCSRPPTAESSNREEMLVMQEQLTKTQQELERVRIREHQNASKLQEAEANLISKEFDLQKLQTQIEKERGLSQYKDYQLREREGLIEANDLLKKERNELAEKFNNHKRDFDQF